MKLYVSEEESSELKMNGRAELVTMADNFGGGVHVVRQEILSLERYVKDQNHEISVLKKALESACEWIEKSTWSIVDGTEEDWERARNFKLYNFYIDQAKKELGGSNETKM